MAPDPRPTPPRQRAAEPATAADPTAPPIEPADQSADQPLDQPAIESADQPSADPTAPRRTTASGAPAGAAEPAPSGTRGGARTTHRRGRMSDAKRRTLATLGPAWLLDPDTAWTADALDRAFGRRAPRLLDIGVGTGDATLALATAHPDHDVLAVELHRPGIARLLHHGDRAAVTNVRVVDGDITRLVAAATGPSLFREVRVLFPDPWPKARHHRRRLVDQAFVRQVVDLVEPGGRLHLATDWLPYADQMRAALAAEPRLTPRVDADDGPAPEGDVPPAEATRQTPAPAGPPAATAGLAAAGLPGGALPTRWRSDRPDRPTTPYERRGLDAGRTITDLVADRTT